MKFFSNKMPSSIREGIKLAAQIAAKPVLLVLISYVIFTAIVLVAFNMPQLSDEIRALILVISRSLLKAIGIGAFFWLVLRALKAAKSKLLSWVSTKPQQTLSIIFPLISNSLEAAIIILMINVIIPEVNLPGFQTEFLEKLANILLIGTLGWLFVQVINGCEKLILYQYATDRIHEVSIRKIRTQTKLLKKIILTIGLIIIASAALMVFDSVKRLGIGLLTTAGAIGAIGAFASQQSLSRLFAGLQIAFTQPIRIGDIIIIENELGEIEEISLSYVTVKLWDLRRLILPTNYFSDKGFQNLTKTSADILGTVFLYVDHTFPIATLRKISHQMLADSKNWDHKIGILQVTDMKEHAIELRLLVSAQDVNTLWDLRCEIREKLIDFITQYYPDCLPKTRNIIVKIKEDDNANLL